MSSTMRMPPGSRALSVRASQLDDLAARGISEDQVELAELLDKFSAVTNLKVDPNRPLGFPGQTLYGRIDVDRD